MIRIREFELVDPGRGGYEPETSLETRGWVRLPLIPSLASSIAPGGWPLAIPVAMDRSPFAPNTPVPYYAHVPVVVYQLLHRIAADMIGCNPTDSRPMLALSHLLQSHTLAALVYVLRAGGLGDLLRENRLAAQARDVSLRPSPQAPERFRGRVR